MRVAVILTTIGEGNASDFCKLLVEKALVSCVERFAVESVYPWKGEICEEKEVSLILKTPLEKRDECVEEIKRSHPYECPQILVCEANVANKAYYDFMLEAVRK